MAMGKLLQIGGFQRSGLMADAAEESRRADASLWRTVEPAAQDLARGLFDEGGKQRAPDEADDDE
jgi:hypothetical protein